MAFANNHVLLRAGGGFGSTGTTNLDAWSVGLRFGVIGADVPWSKNALQTFVDSAWTAFSAFHTTNLAYIGQPCWLAYTTGAVIGKDGHYDPAAQDTVRKDGTPVSGGTTATKPWSTAAVISLRTSKPRGYASNGRVYYPCLSSGIDQYRGRMLPTEVGTRLAAFKTLVLALNTAAATYATNMRLIVASSRGAGESQVVTGIRADERFDQIERRENDQPAIYQTLVI